MISSTKKFDPSLAAPVAQRILTLEPGRGNGRSCYTLFLAVAIHTQALCRYYQMGTATIRAVDQVTLDIQAGEFVALLGASGSGKSSLLNLIAGLDRASSGEVITQGRNLTHLSRNQLAEYRRSIVGMVFQSFNLIPTMTVIENVELPLRFREVERSRRAQLAESALARVGLGQRLGHRPVELSGGEQQRVALARALVNEPSILLADEPTGNLDSRTGSEVMDLVRSLNAASHMTVVLVTHEQAIAEHYAERLIWLADGRVIADQPNAKVLARGDA